MPKSEIEVMTVPLVRPAIMLAVAVLAWSSPGALRAEPSAACKPGSAQTLTGMISMAPSKEDSVGGWMIVAPQFDDANACKVMDFIGTGQMPKGCTEKTHFKASGTVDSAGYALQVKTISCR